MRIRPRMVGEVPRRPIEKQCAWCQRTWSTPRPEARTCSARCRAALIASEEGRPLPTPVPMSGFDFLDNSDFVTTVEVASMLGVPPQTVRYWISTGTLPATGQGGGKGSRIKIRVGEVRRLLARGRPGSLGEGHRR